MYKYNNILSHYTTNKTYLNADKLTINNNIYSLYYNYNYINNFFLSGNFSFGNNNYSADKLKSQNSKQSTI